MRAGNSNLGKARAEKNDEFYTELSDIEKELRHYKDFFKDKVVFCNCDDPEESNFWKYFSLNFEHLGLKKLISTHFERDKPSYKLELGASGVVVKTVLQQNGDFRSPECIEILQEADVVVTNPPFSLFREYIAQLIEYEKKFLVIGHILAVVYKDIFPLLKNNKLWIGYSKPSWFRVPNTYEAGKSIDKVDEDGNKWKTVATYWFTDIPIEKRYESIVLFKKYTSKEYPKYDNYDIINVDEVKNIPCDYYGVMGVPVRFMAKHNPEQFRILGLANSARWIGLKCFTLIEGRKLFDRILIERINKVGDY